MTLTWQQWDYIADAYIPILVLLSLALFSRTRNKHRMAIELFLGIGWAYLLMFIDNALNIWPAFSSDYSTHTAVALVLAVNLSRSLQSALIVSLSTLAYCYLMFTQGYHSVVDMITTSLVILPVLYLIRKRVV